MVISQRLDTDITLDRQYFFCMYGNEWFNARTTWSWFSRPYTPCSWEIISCNHSTFFSPSLLKKKNEKKIWTNVVLVWHRKYCGLEWYPLLGWYSPAQSQFCLCWEFWRGWHRKRGAQSVIHIVLLWKFGRKRKIKGKSNKGKTKQCCFRGKIKGLPVGWRTHKSNQVTFSLSGLPQKAVAHSSKHSSPFPPPLPLQCQVSSLS